MVSDDSTYLGQPMTAEMRHGLMCKQIRDRLIESGIITYQVRYENVHHQSITCKGLLVTESEIIPDEGKCIRELPQINGQVPYIPNQGSALQRERVIEKIRAQASLAGAFHAVHKMKIGEAEPSDAPLNERYVPFTAVPIFIQNKIGLL
jgi:hypothetical protein